jgi:hypothetical protein
MSKFVRQSVYGWQQFRDDIKKETYMFEGKEYLGWDLPMHEQMRLFRIAEARIVEVANYANFSDNNPTSTATAGRSMLFKRSKADVTSSWEFQFAAATKAAFAPLTGSNVAAGGARANSFSGHYIDLSTGWTQHNFGNKRFRLSYESGSTGPSAGTDDASGIIAYEVTAAIDLATQQNATSLGATNPTHSYHSILRDAINNNSIAGGATAMNTYFSASVDSGSSNGGSRLLIMTKHAGAVTTAETSFAAATASVTRVHIGKDILTGPNGEQWSTQEFGASSYTNIRRIKA